MARRPERPVTSFVCDTNERSADKHKNDGCRGATCFEVVFVGGALLSRVTMDFDFLHLYTACIRCQSNMR